MGELDRRHSRWLVATQVAMSASRMLRRVPRTPRRMLWPTIESRPRSGQVERSVLFADLRGYSRYVEGHEPAATFELLEAYAESACRIVRRFHGRILSFYGDGLLAIFECSRKECAALDTARALVDAVNAPTALPCDPAQGEPPIGIGIATGTIFLGRIRHGMGATWSATGDATNIAARLQELSRIYCAPILLDRATFERVSARCIPHPDVRIRGRAGRVDVFVPLGSATATAATAGWSTAREPCHNALDA
jgi:class 3 adenylate cyclase